MNFSTLINLLFRLVFVIVVITGWGRTGFAEDQFFLLYKKATESQNPDERIDFYTKALEIGIKDIGKYKRWVVNSLCNRAKQYSYNYKQYDKALEDVKKAIELDPNDYYSYITAADIYTIKGEYANAILVYDKYLQINSTEAFRAYEGDAIYYKRAWLFMMLNKLDFAIANCNKAIEFYSFQKLFHSHISSFYCLRGDIYRRKGEYEKDIQDLTEALTVKISSISSGSRNISGAYITRGWVYFDKKEYQKATSDFEKIVEILPERNALLGLSLINFEQKNIRKAKEYYGKASKVEPLLFRGMSGIEEIEKKGFFYSEQSKDALTKLFIALGHPHSKK
ncbi:MAG: tetratricopeptide repeat protein [Elusimicrobiota bacterium]